MTTATGRRMYVCVQDGRPRARGGGGSVKLVHPLLAAHATGVYLSVVVVPPLPSVRAHWVNDRLMCVHCGECLCMCVCARAMCVINCVGLHTHTHTHAHTHAHSHMRTVRRRSYRDTVSELMGQDWCAIHTRAYQSTPCAWRLLADSPDAWEVIRA